jgi:uncharacterized ubiquitin-like protein YukD
MMVDQMLSLSILNVEQSTSSISALRVARRNNKSDLLAEACLSFSIDIVEPALKSSNKSLKTEVLTFKNTRLALSAEARLTEFSIANSDS